MSLTSRNHVGIAHLLWEQSKTLNSTIGGEYMDESFAGHGRIKVADPKRPGGGLDLARSIVGLGGDGATGKYASWTQKPAIAIWEADTGRDCRAGEVKLVCPKCGLDLVSAGNDVGSRCESRRRSSDFTIDVGLHG